MTKSTQHSTYQILEDAMMLAGSFAKLGKTIAASKIQQTAESANSYISKVELPDLSAQVSNATEALESASDYALHTDVKQMVDDVGAFARKHPVTALITVVVVGAMFSRIFMRSEPTATKVIAKTRARKPQPKSQPKTQKLAAKSRVKANGTTQAHA